MYIVCYGFSHHETPFQYLEALSLSDEAMRDFLRRLVERGRFKELQGIATCNRLEFYFRCDDPAANVAVIEELLRERLDQPQAFPWERAYQFENEAAVRHLFELACGVDSLVVGEHEILAQLRGAHEQAEAIGVAAGQLDHLTHMAVRLGRRVRRETEIARGNVSVPSIAIKTARQSLGGALEDCRVLIVGAGRMATIAAQQFAKSGAPEIRIVNRSRERAGKLAGATGGRDADFAELPRLIGKADVVVSATGAPDCVIDAEMVRAAIADRDPARPLVLIDLALPRDIDPTVGQLPATRLFAMESLEETARQNREQRRAELQKVRRYIDDQTRRFMDWRGASETRELVGELRQRIEGIRRRSIARSPGVADPEVAERLDRFSDSLLRSVLHDLTANIQKLDPNAERDAQAIEAVRRLFNLRSRNGEKDENGNGARLCQLETVETPENSSRKQA